MTRTQVLALPLTLFFRSVMVCPTDNALGSASTSPETSGNQADATLDGTANWLKIRVGSRTFTATLLSNASVTAFKARLPLTLLMNELNGNEKFAQLPGDLPTNAANPGTIQAGDLMLYGSNTLVLFYETFPTAYSYTKLGRIDNPLELATALGSSNVTVRFEL